MGKNRGPTPFWTFVLQIRDEYGITRNTAQEYADDIWPSCPEKTVYKDYIYHWKCIKKLGVPPPHPIPIMLSNETRSKIEEKLWLFNY